MIRTMIIDAATTCGIMCSSYMSDSQSTLDPVAQVVSRARDGSPLDAVAATRYMYLLTQTDLSRAAPARGH